MIGMHPMQAFGSQKRQLLIDVEVGSEEERGT
jgi:hypothetical protein